MAPRDQSDKTKGFMRKALAITVALLVLAAYFVVFNFFAFYVGTAFLALNAIYLVLRHFPARSKPVAS